MPDYAISFVRSKRRRALQTGANLVAKDILAIAKQPDMAITSQRYPAQPRPAQNRMRCAREKNEGDLEICHDFFGFGNFKHIEFLSCIPDTILQYIIKI